MTRTKLVVFAFSSGVFSSRRCAARILLSHSSTKAKIFASYSIWNLPKTGSSGLASFAARNSVLSLSVCDFGQAPRSIFCCVQERYKVSGYFDRHGSGMKRETGTRTHCIGKKGVGTGPTQEVPANLFIGPMKVRVCNAHSFRAHHLLWIAQSGELCSR